MPRSQPDSVASTHPAAQTPMMRQYLAAKSQHPDAIVLFRMGDFYETFFQDAVDAAHLLELTLTSRNKSDAEPIPMAGVPHHAMWGYVPKLLAAGRRVAVCEQVEDPKTAKGIVKREVVRVITPGVVLDEPALGGSAANYLAAICRVQTGGVALGWVDVSTGARYAATARDLRQGLDELGRIEPSEILICEADSDLQDSIGMALPGRLVTRLDALTLDPNASGPGNAERMLQHYMEHTCMAGRVPWGPLTLQDLSSSVRLGPAAVRNLELLRTLGEGKKKGSLLGLLDHTCTAMGSRNLKQQILYPLMDPAAINQRLECVEALVGDPITRAQCRDELKRVYDLERLMTRIAAATAGPRDIDALANSLEALPGLIEQLNQSQTPALTEIAQRIDCVDEATQLIRTRLASEPPATLKDGGVIRLGYDDTLDELAAIATEGKAWFNRYAEGLKEQTGINSLKVRFNNVFGYFIEVTKANIQYVPETWLRKQTLVNAERYYTPELKEREEAVLGAQDKRIALETELFEGLRAELGQYLDRIQTTAKHVAELDVIAGLAELAQRQGYCRPRVDSGSRIEIREGRHPVIETLVPAGEFVPNDMLLDASGTRLFIITGPNMAGKSTVMRQVALIVLMAQMGSFVPATEAHIGVVDQIFTRVGASDNLSQGLSTFMVEMTEAAEILSESTPRSLVILDEIGRGTSTYDGVSIAWAVAENLHDNVGARTLFATHYHELTELAATREGIENLAVSVRQYDEEIIFLRQLVPGGTNRSYGIQVAKLAGVPEPVITRAKALLANLEANAVDDQGRPRVVSESQGGDHPWQMSLFAPPAKPSAVEARLSELDPNALSPLEALQLIFELKGTLDA